MIATNRDNTVAVDKSYHWRLLDSCPEGVKVQLKTREGVAVHGTYKKGDTRFIRWTPLPTEPENGAKP